MGLVGMAQALTRSDGRVRRVCVRCRSTVMSVSLLSMAGGRRGASRSRWYSRCLACGIERSATRQHMRGLSTATLGRVDAEDATLAADAVSEPSRAPDVAGLGPERPRRGGARVGDRPR